MPSGPEWGRQGSNLRPRDYESKQIHLTVTHDSLIDPLTCTPIPSATHPISGLASGCSPKSSIKKNGLESDLPSRW